MLNLIILLFLKTSFTELLILQMFFEDNIDDAKYCGHLYGLGTSYVQNGAGYETINNYVSQNHNSTPTASSEETNSTPTNS